MWPLSRSFITGAASTTAYDRKQRLQRLDGEFAETANDEVRGLQLRGGVGVRHGNGPKARGPRGLKAPSRVFNGHAAGGVHLREPAQLRDRQKIEIRCGLSPHAVRSRRDRLEAVAEARTVQHQFDFRCQCARSDR